jgi:hypothetical protein
MKFSRGFRISNNKRQKTGQYARHRKRNIQDATCKIRTVQLIEAQRKVVTRGWRVSVGRW